jgi:hypothetical protein
MKDRNDTSKIKRDLKIIIKYNNETKSYDIIKICSEFGVEEFNNVDIDLTVGVVSDTLDEFEYGDYNNDEWEDMLKHED